MARPPLRWPLRQFQGTCQERLVLAMRSGFRAITPLAGSGDRGGLMTGRLFAPPIAQIRQGNRYRVQVSREGTKVIRRPRANASEVAAQSLARADGQAPDRADRLLHSQVGMPTFDNPTSVTGGFDIGARSVKMAILSHSGAASVVVAKAVVPIWRDSDVRDARAAIRDSWRHLLTEATLSASDVDNIASTGTGARQVVPVGHLYGSSIHALGARVLFPDATAALAIEGNEIRCVCLRDPSRYVGQSQGDDHLPGDLARRTVVHLDKPSTPAAGAPLPECLVTRAAILLDSVATEGKVVLTGETVLDTDFVQRLWSRLLALQSGVSLLLSSDAIFAGAYGAAILAARRLTVGPSVAKPRDRCDRSLN